MAENPLKCFETLDPELLKLVGDTRQFALGEGALPKKYKYLIAMALDAAHGSSDGVRNLTQMAMKEGATRQEVAETLRVAQLICGVGSVYTAARGLREVFRA